MAALHKTLVGCTASLLFLSMPAWASKELNISRDGSSDSSSTAVIVTERQAGSGLTGSVTWLLHITDLSLPEAEQKPIKLFSIWSALAGKYPRVSPGSYRVHVGCDETGVVTIKQSFDVRIEAKPGKAYVVGCTGRTANSRETSLREIGQEELPDK